LLIKFFLRIKKAEITLKMLNDFEEGFENMRSWMDITEANLQRPMISQNTNELHLHQQSIAVSDLFRKTKKTTAKPLYNEHQRDLPKSVH
jgi:hypothetical protein